MFSCTITSQIDLNASSCTHLDRCQFVYLFFTMVLPFLPVRISLSFNSNHFHLNFCPDSLVDHPLKTRMNIFTSSENPKCVKIYFITKPLRQEKIKIIPFSISIITCSLHWAQLQIFRTFWVSLSLDKAFLEY